MDKKWKKSVVSLFFIFFWNTISFLPVPNSRVCCASFNTYREPLLFTWLFTRTAAPAAVAVPATTAAPAAPTRNDFRQRSFALSFFLGKTKPLVELTKERRVTADAIFMLVFCLVLRLFPNEKFNVQWLVDQLSSNDDDDDDDDENGQMMMFQRKMSWQ